MTSIGPGLPMLAARAYGLTGPAGGPRSIPPRPSEAAASAGRPTAIRESFAPTPAPAAVRIDAPRPAAGGPDVAARLERLVGGRVPGGVDFTGSAPTASRGDVLPLYTRAADKVEASVAVRLGSALDLRG